MKKISIVLVVMLSIIMLFVACKEDPQVPMPPEVDSETTSVINVLSLLSQFPDKFKDATGASLIASEGEIEDVELTVKRCSVRNSDGILKEQDPLEVKGTIKFSKIDADGNVEVTFEGTASEPETKRGLRSLSTGSIKLSFKAVATKEGTDYTIESKDIVALTDCSYAFSDSDPGYVVDVDQFNKMFESINFVKTLGKSQISNDFTIMNALKSLLKSLKNINSIKADLQLNGKGITAEVISGNTRKVANRGQIVLTVDGVGEFCLYSTNGFFGDALTYRQNMYKLIFTPAEDISDADKATVEAFVEMVNSGYDATNRVLAVINSGLSLSPSEFINIYCEEPVEMDGLYVSEKKLYDENGEVTVGNKEKETLIANHNDLLEDVKLAYVEAMEVRAADVQTVLDFIDFVENQFGVSISKRIVHYERSADAAYTIEKDKEEFKSTVYEMPTLEYDMIILTGISVDNLSVEGKVVVNDLDNGTKAVADVNIKNDGTIGYHYNSAYVSALNKGITLGAKSAYQYSTVEYSGNLSIGCAVDLYDLCKNKVLSGNVALDLELAETEEYLYTIVNSATGAWKYYSEIGMSLDKLAKAVNVNSITGSVSAENYLATENNKVELSVEELFNTIYTQTLKN